MYYVNMENLLKLIKKKSQIYNTEEQITHFFLEFSNTLVFFQFLVLIPTAIFFIIQMT